MMLKPLKVPRGVANIFMIGCVDVKKINEEFSYRPDKILNKYGMKSIGKEMVNNHLTNLSPISCTTGKEYFVTDALFNAYFVR